MIHGGQGKEKRDGQVNRDKLQQSGETPETPMQQNSDSKYPEPLPI